MCSSGQSTRDDARRIARLAVVMQQHCASYIAPDGSPLQMRIGLVTGPALGGVVGASMLRYHVFGGVTSEVTCYEQSAPHGGILCSGGFRNALEGKFRSISHREAFNLGSAGGSAASLGTGGGRRSIGTPRASPRSLALAAPGGEAAGQHDPSASASELVVDEAAAAVARPPPVKAPGARGRRGSLKVGSSVGSSAPAGPSEARGRRPSTEPRGGVRFSVDAGASSRRSASERQPLDDGITSIDDFGEDDDFTPTASFADSGALVEPPSIPVDGPEFDFALERVADVMVGASPRPAFVLRPAA